MRSSRVNPKTKKLEKLTQHKEAKANPKAVTKNSPIVSTKGQFSFENDSAIDAPEKGSTKGSNDTSEGAFLGTLRETKVLAIRVTHIRRRSDWAEEIGHSLDVLGNATIITKETQYHWNLERFMCPRCKGCSGAGRYGKPKEFRGSIHNENLRSYEDKFKGFLVEWIVEGAQGPSAVIYSETCFLGAVPKVRKDGTTKDLKATDAKGLRNLLLQDPILKAKIRGTLPNERSS